MTRDETDIEEHIVGKAENPTDRVLGYVSVRILSVVGALVA